MEAVPVLLIEGDPLTVCVSFELTEDEPDIVVEPVELAEPDSESAGDPEYEGDPEAETLATEALAVQDPSEVTVDSPELLFDTIPVIVCVVVLTSVRVPVAVTD